MEWWNCRRCPKDVSGIDTDVTDCGRFFSPQPANRFSRGVVLLLCSDANSLVGLRLVQVDRLNRRFRGVFLMSLLLLVPYAPHSFDLSHPASD